MIDVFLSASIPLPKRDAAFFASADILNIREALKALVEVLLPHGRITFGGHPAITPLISLFIEEAKLDRGRLTVFQSRYFEGQFPAANNEFYDVRLIDAVPGDRESSLSAMRSAMVESRKFKAAVFIGGMQGVIDEALHFSRVHPAARMIPIASTGAAAARIFDHGKFAEEFRTNLTYPTLFRRHLIAGLH